MPEFTDNTPSADSDEFTVFIDNIYLDGPGLPPGGLRVNVENFYIRFVGPKNAPVRLLASESEAPVVDAAFCNLGKRLADVFKQTVVGARN